MAHARKRNELGIWVIGSLQPLDGRQLGFRELRAERAPGIGKEAQRAGGGDRGIQLAQAAGGSIAGVSK